MHAVGHAAGGETIAGESAVAERFGVERAVPLISVTDRAQRVTHRTAVSRILENGATQSCSRCRQPGWGLPSIWAGGGLCRNRPARGWNPRPAPACFPISLMRPPAPAPWP